MDKVTLGGTEYGVRPLNLRLIRELMASGQFERLQQFATLKQEEQLDLMVAFVAAALGARADDLWDNLGVEDFNQLPVVFNAVMSKSGFKGESTGPNAESR